MSNKKHLLILVTVTFFFCLQHSQVIAQQKNNLVLFGRGIYPGDDSTFQLIRNSGFQTLMLSSFYIRSNGDVYSGDDNRHPIIHEGRFTGDPEWIKRVASLRGAGGSIRRIEVLLEGRWFNQAPNTYDFIRDWLDSSKGDAGVITGTGDGSTLHGILKILKEEIGADAICIDDESVYDSLSIIRLGGMAHLLGMKMTLCPYTRIPYWKSILDSTAAGVVDAIYLQCYDGGRRNTPAPWVKALSDKVPVYPIFLCRGAFSTCATNHNSKTPGEIMAAMKQYKIEYPALQGAGIWQMEDIKSYVRRNCAVQDPSSGTATSVVEYLTQLKNSLQ